MIDTPGAFTSCCSTSKSHCLLLPRFATCSTFQPLSLPNTLRKQTPLSDSLMLPTSDLPSTSWPHPSSTSWPDHHTPGHLPCTLPAAQECSYLNHYAATSQHYHLKNCTTAVALCSFRCATSNELMIREEAVLIYNQSYCCKKAGHYESLPT